MHLHNNLCLWCTGEVRGEREVCNTVFSDGPAVRAEINKSKARGGKSVGLSLLVANGRTL